VSIVGFKNKKSAVYISSTVSNPSAAHAILDESELSEEVLEIYRKLEYEWMDRIHDKGLIYVKNIEDEIVFGDSSCDVLFNGYHNTKEEKLEGPGICIWQGANK
jgi:hypothetical protein